MHESGLALFKRGATLRRKRASANTAGATGGAGAGAAAAAAADHKSKGCLGDIGPGPKDAWMIYCWFLTCCVPPAMLRMCGTFASLSVLSHVLAVLTPSDRHLLPGATTSLAREDGTHQHHPFTHGRCRFPYIRIHRSSLRDTS